MKCNECLIEKCEECKKPIINTGYTTIISAPHIHNFLPTYKLEWKNVYYLYGNGSISVLEYVFQGNICNCGFRK